MKDYAIKLVNILNKKQILIAAISIFALFVFFALPYFSNLSEELTNSSESPDINLFYSAEYLYYVAQSYGEQGREAYIILKVTFDIVWPVIYLFFLVALFSAIISLKTNYNKQAILILLPFLAVIFDFLENIFVSIVMYRYPVRTDFIAEMAPIMTLLKWISLFICFVLIFYLSFLNIFNKLKNSSFK